MLSRARNKLAKKSVLLNLSAPVFTLLLLALIVGLPQWPKAHAGGTIVQTDVTSWPSGCTTFCQVTSNTPIASGNWLFIVISVQATTDNVCSAVSNIIDKFGSSLQVIDGGCYQSGSATISEFMYVEQIPSTKIDTVNVTMTGSISASGLSLLMIEVSGVNTFFWKIGGAGIFGSGVSATTLNSITLPSTYFALTALTAFTHACPTVQGGFTDYGGYFGGGNGCTDFGYGSNPNITSPTNFPWTMSNGGIDIGVVFSASPATAFTVTACNYFQLQCWLYPFFVFGIYLIMIGGLAAALRVPLRDMTGHILEAFSLAAITCILFGIVNIMPALLVIIVQVVRAIRE